ncbi:hypothetical protein BDFB_007734, partial [Asbolus verrucosus]
RRNDRDRDLFNRGLKSSTYGIRRLTATRQDFFLDASYPTGVSVCLSGSGGIIPL